MGRRRQVAATYEPSEDDIDLGPCCVCERLNRPNNIVCLELKASVPGTGWGCAVCGVPQDGAMAMVCDGCMGLELRYAAHGFLEGGQRIPIGQLKEPFKHTKPESEH